MALQQEPLRSVTLAVVAILYLSYGQPLEIGTAFLVQAAVLLAVLAAPPPVKKQISHDWSDVAGQYLLALGTIVKRVVQHFSVQNFTFLVLSFLCVKALATFGLVPRSAVVLLALLVGAFLRVAKQGASSVTCGSHQTLEGVGCEYTYGFWYEEDNDELATYECALTEEILDSVFEINRQEVGIF